MFRFIQNVSAVSSFFPSYYDPKVDPEDPLYLQRHEFLKEHSYERNPKNFGDVLIATMNAHIDRDTLETPQLVEIMRFIDTHHPTVLSLQGLSNTESIKLKKSIQGHYGMACADALMNEVRMNKIEAMPIIFDANSLGIISEKVFSPEKYTKLAYGCVAVFYSKEMAQVFTVVNVDLVGTDESVIDTQIYSIMKYLKTQKTYKDQPVFLTGTINQMSERLRKLIQTDFENLNDLDRNNTGLSKTTFHSHGVMDDGVQRDFILLRDKEKKFKLNLSRILERYPKIYFEHFPVYAILEHNRR